MNKVYKFGKYFLYIAFTIGIVVGFGDEQNSNNLFQIIYIVSLSGLIGLSTNTIAIYMLFRPLKKTIFGRQGIIPRNKEKMANSLANAVRERILNEETISLWLGNEQFIEDKIQILIEKLKDYLNEGKNQEKIRQYIKKFYTYSQKEEVLQEISNFLIKILEDYWISNSLSFYKLYGNARKYLKNEKNNKNIILENSTKLIREIITLFIKNNSENIAMIINDKIDEFIAEKGIIKSLILSVGKFFFLSAEDIENHIIKFINDEQKLKVAGDTFENLLPGLDDVLNDKNIKDMSRELFETVKSAFFIYIKTKKIPELSKKIENIIEDFFNDETKFNEAFEKLKTFLFRFIESLLKKLNGELKSGNITEFLRSFRLGEIIENLVRKNILKQNLEEFEILMKKIMGENLAFIEILGGILGMLIGIGIQYQVALIIVPILILFLLALEYGIGILFKYIVR